MSTTSTQPARPEPGRFPLLMPKAALLFISFVLLLTAQAQAQNTYYWRGGTGANWSASTSWNTLANGTGTARTSRNTGDVLIFSGGNSTATMDLTETIRQLSFTNNATVTLTTTTDATRTITLGGGTGDDFVVAAGSSLTMVGVVSNNNQAAIIFVLNNGVTGSIAGTVTFTSSGSTNGSDALHELRGGEGSVHFTNGGSLVVAGRMNGDSFGTTAGMAVFEAGATYQQNATNSDDPYGPATFADGSTYRYLAGGFGASNLTVSRSYGNLSYESTSDRTIGGSMNLLIRNNLTLSSTGNLSLNARNTDGTSIGGNVSITNNSAVLIFDPSSTRPVTLNGAAARTVSGVGTVFFGENAQLEIDNPAGVTLTRPITVDNSLLLTRGLLTTSATALLTLTENASITGGSTTSFVNGPLARIAQRTNGTQTLIFPIGKGTAYRPLTLKSSNQNADATYTVEQFEGNPGQTVTGTLQRVSFKRAYSISSSNTSATNTTATVMLSFAPDDYVNVPGTANLVVARRQGTGGAWSTMGHSANTGPAGATGGPGVSGTLTSNSLTGFTTGSATYFALGALNLNNQANPFATAVNPLPVELTRFDATAKVQGIALSWATATEKNSDYFEVQRSADGESFQRVGSMQGQGSSSNAHEYAFMDGHPLTGLSYYRLRQVDTDGTSTFSPVVTAQVRGEVAVYPNPSTGTVSLPATLGTVRYRVLNVLGQVVLSGQATGNDQLDLRTLAKGPFFLELTGASGHTMQRLVRE